MTFKDIESKISLIVILILFSIPGWAEKSTGLTIKWLSQHSSSTSSFRGVWAVNDTIAWASGSKGTFLRTLNAGKTWEKGSVPGALTNDFRDIYAIDANTAYLMGIGSPARFYKTVDGGQNWNLIYSNNQEGIFFSSMEFWDQDNGIAVSDPVKGNWIIIITRDGGKTWEKVPVKRIPAPVQGEALFAASGTCITLHGDMVWFASGGPVARVYRSLDRGHNWEVFNTPVLCGESSTGIFSIAFKDKRQGIIVGGDYQKPQQTTKNAALTFDGGKTWHLVKDSPPNGFRSCVAYLSLDKESLLITTGPSGSDYSLDGGRTWTNFETYGYHSFSFVKNSLSGWAVGAKGRVAKFKFHKK
jgi:photosystem II stability/assembly factor-like uncharacterized protein